MHRAGLALLLFLVVQAVAWADSRGGTLEVEVLGLRASSDTSTAMEVRFVNTSPDDIRQWGIVVEVYDGEGELLGTGDGMISQLRAGASKIGQVMIGARAADIARWKVRINGVVAHSGFREDGKYRLILK